MLRKLDDLFAYDVINYVASEIFSLECCTSSPQMHTLGHCLREAFNGDKRLCTIQERTMHKCVLENKAIEIDVATCLLESIFSIIVIFIQVALMRIAKSYFSR